MSTILAIDPGPTKSAFVLRVDGEIYAAHIWSNEVLRAYISCGFEKDMHMAIEMIGSYGMPVGKDVFETCVWIGRFIEAFCGCKKYNFVYRKDIKMHLCNSMKAKDANIRQALIDKFPATGGGKIPQIGTKKQPGPLYGIKKDIWSALAVAVYYDEVILNNQG